MYIEVVYSLGTTLIFSLIHDVMNTITKEQHHHLTESLQHVEMKGRSIQSANASDSPTHALDSPSAD